MEEQKLINKKRNALSKKNLNLACETCAALGNLYDSQGEYKRAINEYEYAAKIRKDQNNMLEYAVLNRGIGEGYMMLGKFDTGMEHLHRYLDVCKEIQNRVEEQRALATLGRAFMTKYFQNNDKSDLNKAKHFLLKSLKVCESLEIKKVEKVDMSSRVFCNLGTVHEILDDFEKGIYYLQKAIDHSKQYQCYETLQQAYYMMASLLDKKEDFNESIKMCSLSIEIAKKLENKKMLICTSLILKSEILLKVGDLNGAKNALHKAYKLKTQNIKENHIIERNLKLVVLIRRTEDKLITTNSNSYPELKELYEKMADYFSELGLFQRAIEFYKKMESALENYNGDLASCYYSLAKTYKDTKQYNLAIIYFEKEYALTQNDLANSLNTLCEIIDTKELAGYSHFDICSIYEKALDSCRKAGNKTEEGRMLSRYVGCLRKEGRHTEAYKMETLLLDTGYSQSTSESESDDEHLEVNTNSYDDVCLEEITDESDGSDIEDITLTRTKKRCPKAKTIRRNEKGETQLHTACIKGELNVVQLLLGEKHPLDVRDYSGWLPLHEACFNGHFEIVKLLLEKGATKYIQDKGGIECDGKTPLHNAAENCHLEIVKLLLENGASPLDKTHYGETPYHLLVKARVDEHLTETENQLYEALIKQMGTILDRAGVSKEIKEDNENRNAALNETDHPSQRSTRTPNARISKDLRRRVDNEISSDSEPEDTTSQIPQKTDLKKNNATNEYKRVMEELRHKTPKEETSRGGVLKRSAPLGGNNVGDDWLENDLPENKNKKRRTGTYNSLPNVKPSAKPISRYNSSESLTSRSSRSSHNTKSPEKRLRKNSNETIRSFDDNDVEMVGEFFANKQNELDIIENYELDNILSSNLGENQLINARKKQTTLTNNGYIRSTSPANTIKSTSSNSSRKSGGKIQPKITNFSTTSAVNPIRISRENDLQFVSDYDYAPFARQQQVLKPINMNTQSANFGETDPMLAMDVSIEGRPFRVTARSSEKNTLTIKWLALEAARRYSKKQYIEPVLELTTSNGAELVDDDVIASLFISDSKEVEVQARVLKWNLPSICERYKGACTDLDTRPLDVLCKTLDELSVSLDVKNHGFLPEALAPLCKSLSRESRLIELELSNNFLSLDCVKFLCSSLPTLENLMKINLSCTNLDTESLRCISNMLVTSPMPVLQKLNSLDISKNFIKDESLQDIASITRVTHLKELNLSFLSFSSELFSKSYNRSVKFNLEKLESLDLSNNGLSNNDIEMFLTEVNATYLRFLNVSNNATSDNFGVNLVSVLGKNGTQLNLDVLNLARCKIQDADIFNILSLAKNIQEINLSYTDITGISLRRLLESLATKTLTLIGCNNINKYIDCDIIDSWRLENHVVDNKPKSIKINLDEINCELLIKLWKNFHLRLQIEKMGGFLEITVL